MKLKITLSAEKPIILPIHYNYILQSFIYNSLDPIYSAFLHKEGFVYEKRKFKLFTFSKIFGKKKILKKEKKIIFHSPVKLYVSFITEEFLNSHAKNLILKETMRLGKNKLTTTSIEIIKEQIHSDNTEVKTLSPITIHSTDENGKTIYYNPYQEKFYKLLEENLKKKCKILGIENGLDEIEIIPSKIAIFKKAVILYKNNFVIEGWNGKFIIKANPEIIEIALKAGLGDRNSMGFGMIAPG